MVSIVLVGGHARSVRKQARPYFRGLRASGASKVSRATHPTLSSKHGGRARIATQKVGVRLELESLHFDGNVLVTKMAVDLRVLDASMAQDSL